MHHQRLAQGSRHRGQLDATVHAALFSYGCLSYGISCIICDMRSVLIIIPEGGMVFIAAAVADILMRANYLNSKESGTPLYEVTLAATQPELAVQGQSGLNLLADQCLGNLDPEAERDTIMVTGRGATEAEGAAIADWIRRAAPTARRVVSLCAGALVLARAGLLNGHRATTHWRLLDTLQARFPEVSVQRGPIYIQDGSIWTSAGVSAGFDLTLALIEDDYGFTLARDVAQDLVMFLRRPGGQSQFSRYLLDQAKTPGPIRDLQAWILENLAGDLSVEKLAGRVSMSARNFTRVFTRETGISPGKYVENARLDAARHRLEQSKERLEQVAAATGFGSALNLRRVFEKNLGLSPTDYRSRFSRRDLS